MFKLKYRIISQTGKGNCEKHKEYVFSLFCDVCARPPYSNINILKPFLPLSWIHSSLSGIAAASLAPRLPQVC